MSNDKQNYVHFHVVPIQSKEDEQIKYFKRVAVQESEGTKQASDVVEDTNSLLHLNSEPLRHDIDAGLSIDTLESAKPEKNLRSNKKHDKQFRIRILLKLLDKNPSFSFGQTNQTLIFSKGSSNQINQNQSSSVNIVRFLKILQIHNKKLSEIEKDIVDHLIYPPVTHKKFQKFNLQWLTRRCALLSLPRQKKAEYNLIELSKMGKMQLTESEFRTLKRIYTSLTNPAAYGSPANLKKASGFPMKKIRLFLESSKVYTKLRASRQKFPRLKERSLGINHIWSLDVAFLETFSK